MGDLSTYCPLRAMVVERGGSKEMVQAESHYETIPSIPDLLGYWMCVGHLGAPTPAEGHSDGDWFLHTSSKSLL